MISIVIVNYNGEKWAKECLDSVFNMDFCGSKYEIIVVDNNSQDGSVKMIEKYHKVKLIKSKENTGFAKGNNIGIEKSKGDYVILLNNDLIVDKNWIKETLPLMEKDSRIGAIGGKIFYGRTKDVWFSGAKVYFGGFTRHKYLGDRSGECDYIVGAAVMFRADILKKLNGFDEKFYLYSEDSDLSYRIKKEGYRLVYNPLAISYHMITKGRVSKHQEYYEQRNRVYFYMKRYNFLGKLLFLFLDFGIFFPLFWANRVRGNWKRIFYWRETLKARIDSVRMSF